MQRRQFVFRFCLQKARELVVQLIEQKELEVGPRFLVQVT